MWAWILIDEPSPVAEDTVHTALEMALRRDHRSMVIVPSARPGKALVLGIAGAQRTTPDVSAVQHGSPDVAPAFEAPEPLSDESVAPREMSGPIPDELVSSVLAEAGLLDADLSADEFGEVEPGSAEELSAPTPDEVPSDTPEPPSPKYIASGFLGLIDEAISEEEPPSPPTKWWQKLFR